MKRFSLRWEVPEGPAPYPIQLLQLTHTLRQVITSDKVKASWERTNSSFSSVPKQEKEVNDKCVSVVVNNLWYASYLPDFPVILSQRLACNCVLL